MYRVLKPGGRLFIGDIIVQRPVPERSQRQHRPLDRSNCRRSAGSRARSRGDDERVRRLRGVLARRRLRRRTPTVPGRGVRRFGRFVSRAEASL